MTLFPQTLWDLLSRRQRSRRRPSPAPTAAVPRRRAIQDRYDALVEEMKNAYGVRVHRWRGSSSGCAWEVHYDGGRVARLIEAPRPRGPVSCAIFLHEIGHHAIGFRRFRPRCLEEYHAWRWALAAMREHGFNVTPAVERRMGESLRYAVAKARRRGLREVPAELLPYVLVGG
ncbi:MAG: hypothetical protein GY715_05850 [Planctomycetes bacterium]|nr:hypothetical protein [Planctomycetota bacterium]